jgi:hypothetical protein
MGKIYEVIREVLALAFFSMLKNRSLEAERYVALRDAAE